MLISGNTMVDLLVSRSPIGDHKSVKAVFFLQNPAKQTTVDRRGNTVQGIKGRHRRNSTRLNCRLVGRHIRVAEGHLTQFDGIVFPSRLGRTVGGKVLEAGTHIIRFTEIIALIAPHDSTGKQRVEIRIFARGFQNAAPSGISDEVKHWREGNVYTGNRSLDRRNARHCLDRFLFERATKRKGDRENRAEAVNNIAHKERWDLVRVMCHMAIVDLLGAFSTIHQHDAACIDNVLRIDTESGCGVIAHKFAASFIFMKDIFLITLHQKNHLCQFLAKCHLTYNLLYIHLDLPLRKQRTARFAVLLNFFVEYRFVTSKMLCQTSLANEALFSRPADQALIKPDLIRNQSPKTICALISLNTHMRRIFTSIA